MRVGTLLLALLASTQPTAAWSLLTTYPDDEGCSFAWLPFPGCTPMAECKLHFKPRLGTFGPCKKRPAKATKEPAAAEPAATEPAATEPAETKAPEEEVTIEEEAPAKEEP